MPEKFFFETDRMRFRQLTIADFDFFFPLQCDAELMRYIRPPETDPEPVKARVELYEKYAAENPGLGSFLGVLKSTGEAVATGVLREMELQAGQDLELGYLIVRKYWGQGLATEMTAGLARYAFEKFGVDVVRAIIDPAHTASQKVVQKCGFKLVGPRFIYETDNLEFVLARSG